MGGDRQQLKRATLIGHWHSRLKQSVPITAPSCFHFWAIHLRWVDDQSKGTPLSFNWWHMASTGKEGLTTWQARDSKRECEREREAEFRGTRDSTTKWIRARCLYPIFTPPDSLLQILLLYMQGSPREVHAHLPGSFLCFFLVSSSSRVETARSRRKLRNVRQRSGIIR